MDARKRELLRLGVTHEAIATTLPHAGRGELRAFVETEDDQAYPDGGAVNLLLPHRLRDGAEALHRQDLAFYLVMKELHLRGLRIAIVGLAELVKALEQDDELDLQAIAGEEDPAYLGIPDFYRPHADYAGWPFAPSARLLLEAWLRRRYYRHGTGLVLRVDVADTGLAAWYTPGFSTWLDRRALSLSVPQG